MTTVEEHQRTVAALLPATGAERVPLAEAEGRVLAEDVTAPMSLPPFDNSAMDGYAVRAADAAAAPVTLPVAADIPAGRTDVPPLEPGTAHRIMTGAAVPSGADAVVKVELTDGGTETVRITESPTAGDHLRAAGDDVAAGATVLTAGSVLSPAAVGLAAALGIGELPVRRRPVVLVVSTGTELVAAGNPLLPGQIYDSNGVTLAAAVRAAGGAAIRTHAVADDVPTFLGVLDEYLDRVDLIMTSGGVSAGAYEVVKDGLATNGVRFGGVAMQPGGPQGAGTYRGVPVVTLPGNPVSSLVSFEMFVRPALRAAFGHPHPARPVATARIADAADSPSGRRQFRRGVYRDGEVRLVGGAGSHLLAAMAVANCLVILDESTVRVEAGDQVRCLLLD